LRKDVLESPRGLNGLVFKVSDTDASRQTLSESGLAMLEPQSFSRPVTIDGVEHLARFRTVRAAPEMFEAGRVYYCQHYTPELVWHRPWMSHPNGVRGLRELVIVTDNAEVEIPRYAKAAQSSPERQRDDWVIALSGSFRLTLISLARYRARYGELAVEGDGRSGFFGAIVLDAPDLVRVSNLASSITDVRIEAGQGALRVQVPFSIRCSNFADNDQAIAGSPSPSASQIALV
jgi:hypothetical protein